MTQFVTYLTKYSGNLLPPYYIGSTTLEKALSGKYFGSIRSKKYRDIFKQELTNNIDLFSIKILSYHETRKEALANELVIQKENNVVHSTEYFNESYASVNGFFGRKVTGVDSPAYGKTNKSNTGRKLTEKHKQNISKGNMGKLHSNKTKNKISESHKGMTYSDETKQKLSDMAKELRKNGKGNPPPPPMFGPDNPMYGRELSVETKKKISDSLLGQNNHPKSISINKLDLKHKFIESYSSLREAELRNNLPLGKLRYTIKNKGKREFTLNNFIWSLETPNE